MLFEKKFKMSADAKTRHMNKLNAASKITKAAHKYLGRKSAWLQTHKWNRSVREYVGNFPKRSKNASTYRTAKVIHRSIFKTAHASKENYSKKPIYRGWSDADLGTIFGGLQNSVRNGQSFATHRKGITSFSTNRNVANRFSTGLVFRLRQSYVPAIDYGKRGFRSQAENESEVLLPPGTFKISKEDAKKLLNRISKKNFNRWNSSGYKRHHIYDVNTRFIPNRKVVNYNTSPAKTTSANQSHVPKISNNHYEWRNTLKFKELGGNYAAHYKYLKNLHNNFKNVSSSRPKLNTNKKGTELLIYVFKENSKYMSDANIRKFSTIINKIAFAPLSAKIVNRLVNAMLLSIKK